MSETAVPAFIVVPGYEAGAPATFEPRSRARTLLHLVDNAFNFSLHGAAGFRRACRLVDSVRCLDLRYGDLEEGVEAMERLLEEETDTVTAP